MSPTKADLLTEAAVRVAHAANSFMQTCEPPDSDGYILMHMSDLDELKEAHREWKKASNDFLESIATRREA